MYIKSPAYSRLSTSFEMKIGIMMVKGQESALSTVICGEGCAGKTEGVSISMTSILSVAIAYSCIYHYKTPIFALNGAL